MNHYYDKTNLNRIPELISLSPEAAAAFFKFEEEVYHGSSSLPLLTKELLALTVAHVTGCPYCIDVHVRKYKALGGTMEEIMEALLVAASTRSGAILSHGVHALLAFTDMDSAPVPGKEPKETLQTAPNHLHGAPPEGPACFC